MEALLAAARSTGGIVLMAVMIVLFFGVMVYVGIYCRRKAKDVNGFVLGGRSVGPWLTAFTYGTSYFSAVIFIGYAGQFGYLFGVASTWIGIGNAIIGSLLAWVILGRRTRVMTQYLDTKTMPEFFGKRFDSNALKIVSAVIVFVFLIPYTASLFNGLSRLFTVAFGFSNENLAYIIIVLIMAVLTGVYVLVGGYMATAINDFIQGIIMLVGIVAVIAVALNANGGLTGSMEALVGAADADGLAGWKYTSFFGAMPVFLFFVIILTSLGTWGLPQMVNKFYAIKSENDIRKGTIISTVFAIIVAGGCYFLGGFGHLFVPTAEFTAYDAIVPTILDKTIRSDFLMGIVVILVLSASMSTLSSLVLTSSSTLTLDLIKGHIVKKERMTEQRQMIIMRVLLACFIAVSAAIAIVQKLYNVSTIAQLMGVSWGALAGAFLAPFLYGLYSKKITKASVWASFAVGVSISIFSFVCSLTKATFMTATLSSGETLNFANAVVMGAIAMIAGLIVVPLVSLCTYRYEVKKGKLDTARMDAVFSCFQGTVTVRRKDSLGTVEVADETIADVAGAETPVLVEADETTAAETAETPAADTPDEE
ncbi:MAG: sodium:solute symporter [Clostridia bacterium]|nr:sodium:solute symporter [Clostridia bacterium]